MTTIAVPRRRILRPRLPNLAAIKRLGDPSLNRLGIRGQPWGLGRAGGAPSFLPSDLDNLILWLRADTITGLNDGDAVATWQDDSGQGNDVTQGVAANRPTYQTNERNGLPIVRFDGINDVLTVTLGGEIAVPNTVILVARHISGAIPANEFMVGCKNPAFAITTTIFADSAGPAALSGFSGITVRTIALDAAYHYSDWVVDGLSSIVRVDGVDFSSDLGALSILDIGIGANPSASNFADVDIAEVILYSDGKTPVDLDNLDSYIVSKWGF